MALPKLNIDAPSYSLTVPSTKKTINYRPFLVKEQRNLLIALESKDPKMVLNAVLTCIESCSPNINASKLSTFDVDYMFTQVRSKSVGETTQLLHACSECNEENEVKINLQDVNIVTNGNWDNEKNIKLTNEITVELKYPTYADILKNKALDGENISGAEVIFESIISCLNSVKTETENIMIKDETKEEIERFMNSLTNEQLEKITNLVENMPTLSHAEKYECKKCKHENIIELKGLNDFF